MIGVIASLSYLLPYHNHHPNKSSLTVRSSMMILWCCGGLVLWCQMESHGIKLGNTQLNYLPLNHMQLRPQKAWLCCVSSKWIKLWKKQRGSGEAVGHHSCLASCIWALWIDADRLNICVFLLWSKKGRELQENVIQDWTEASFSSVVACAIAVVCAEPSWVWQLGLHRIWGHRDLQVATLPQWHWGQRNRAVHVLSYTNLAEISAMISRTWAALTHIPPPHLHGSVHLVLMNSSSPQMHSIKLPLIS